MATIKDVAEEAGLAVSTVSRVLNNRGYISDAARKKVNDAMAKLNYQPNELARSLHRKNTNMMGVIVPHIRHPYFAEVISNIEYYAYKKGYKVLLYNTRGASDREMECVEMCRSNRVDGIIMCTGGIALEGFHSLGLPVISFERNTDVSDASIECDNTQGGRMAGELLLKKGCKHILHIGDMSRDYTMPGDSRGLGLHEVCQQAGVECIDIIVDRESYTTMQYHDVIEQALTEHPEVDGIFANSDIIAAQILQVCRKLQIDVPGQVKVIGFDDVQISSLTAPQLTTIHQPIEEMAEIAVQMFDNVVNNKAVPKRTVLPVKLIERESTL